ncbi:MAG: type I-C CRISPR-associated protein Cas8c/Csd1 [Deltaproteobacteria bacterium]|nr:type I-C CRISPR-associated protein Cas8c/Csd1 [Deltaproteobacteria bacterium]
MILQALTSYYRRISVDSEQDIAPEGFQKKEIPFVIVLDHEGFFKGLLDTREGEGKNKRARSFTVPREIKRSGKNSWETANLLWDNEGYVLGFSNQDKEKAKKQHKSFIAKIRGHFPDPVTDEGVSSILKFLERGDFSAVITSPTWAEVEKKGGNLSFMLEGDIGLVSQRVKVINAINAAQHEDDNVLRQQCMVTGELDSPVRLHASIKGVWGAQTAGANIVSFNLPAFSSYGKEQGYNAPVGKKAEFAYTTALNTMLSKGSHQRIQVGDASTVFWAEHENPIEDAFYNLFGMSAENSEQDYEAIKALYKAPITGAPPLDDEDLTPFYVLGLSPNAARISVRFWYAGTVGDARKNITLHFEDCSMVHGKNQPSHLKLLRLLCSTALQGKVENVQPNLAGDFMKAILGGTLYPQTLLSSAIRRARAERDVTYPRAALIKGVLAREKRFYHTEEKELNMSLDQTNMNTGYLLGRLFAVLERAQEFANPGINATIRDRFYGAASSTPVTVFPHLLKLKNHHIAKLESKGLAVNLEKLTGEIMIGLNEFPAHLKLQDQGRFAVGYYHQRQDFFTKKES